MPILDDGRWEKYAQLLAAGELSDVDAHEAAGFKRNSGNANRLKGNERIQARVEELKEASAERAEIDRALVLQNIRRIADKAYEDGQYTPALNGWVKLGQETCGMFEQKSTVTHKREPVDYSDEDLIAVIAARAERDSTGSPSIN